MSQDVRRRLAVWGDPIAHSRSPQVHSAAYAVLGVDWEYGRRRVDAQQLPDALAERDSTWRGLSLTMPLKEGAFRAAGTRDTHATLTGAVNTLLFRENGDVAGFNTDIAGLVTALKEGGVNGLTRARIIGAGATAASGLVAVAELGAEQVEVVARTPDKAKPLVELAARLGVACVARPFEHTYDEVDLTLSTLPSGTDLGADRFDPLVAHGGALLDAAYAPWPTPLAARWGSDVPVVSGFGMLLHQAVCQIRIFLHEDPAQPLPGEADVVAAMRSALLPDSVAEATASR